MIDYTAEEIRRLLHQTLWHVTIPHAIVFAQSLWRRAHQAVPGASTTNDANDKLP